jgi:GTP-binding protein
VTDTGGLTNTTQNFDAEIERQVRYAIDESDCILFIVSNKDGVDAKDFYVAKLLKKYKQQNKKVLLLVNKSENTNTTMERQYFALGFGKPYYVSAEHGVGIGDVLDEVIKTKPTLPPKEEEKRTKFCIIGRTNVGKSTLMNCILQKERVVASPIEHTTRDAVDEDFKYQGKNYTIIDTAGIRRKGKIGNGIEKYAVMRTQQAIERSDVILLVLDASTDFNEQDEVIGGLAYKANVPTIIVVNK